MTKRFQLCEPTYISAGDRQKAALIFVHAFPLGAEQWRAQLETFSKDYFCVAIDLPGFGRAALPEQKSFTLEAYVDYFEDCLDRLNLTQSTWVGLSMGGYVLLRALERFEKRARAVVLCDTKSAADGNEAKLKRWAAIQGVARNFDEFVSAQTKALMGEKAQKNPEIAGKFEALIRKNSVAGIQAGLMALVSRTDTTEGLPKLQVPALILVGEADKVTPLADAQALQKGISGAQLAVIPEAGHLSNLEAEKAFQEHLSTFLKSL